MWDNLGASVDINLDNLMPHSKGSKNTPTNIPMNAMMNQSNQMNKSNSINMGLSSPPMSPLGKK